MRLNRPWSVDCRSAITPRPSSLHDTTQKSSAQMSMVSSHSIELKLARACTMPVPRIMVSVDGVTRLSNALAHMSLVVSETERTMQIIMRVSTAPCSTMGTGVSGSQLRLQKHLAQSCSVFSE